MLSKQTVYKHGKSVTMIVMAAILAAAVILSLMTREEYSEVEVLSGMKSVNGVFSTDELSIGQILVFGKYEQDGIEENGTEIIQWRVLDIDDDKVLLISERLLDCKPYNEGCEDVTWAECTLRKWLNEDFINAAFDESDQSKIVLSNIHNPYNPSFCTAGCENTDDRVFALSVDELKKYFQSDEDKKVEITRFAATKQRKLVGYLRSNWWLRTPGSSHSQATTMSNDGCSLCGWNVDCKYVCVRPAMWVKI